MTNILFKVLYSFSDIILKRFFILQGKIFTFPPHFFQNMLWILLQKIKHQDSCIPVILCIAFLMHLNNLIDLDRKVNK